MWVIHLPTLKLKHRNVKHVGQIRRLEAPARRVGARRSGDLCRFSKDLGGKLSCEDRFTPGSWTRPDDGDDSGGLYGLDQSGGKHDATPTHSPTQGLGHRPQPPTEVDHTPRQSPMSAPSTRHATRDQPPRQPADMSHLSGVTAVIE